MSWNSSAAASKYRFISKASSFRAKSRNPVKKHFVISRDPSTPLRSAQDDCVVHFTSVIEPQGGVRVV
jgi:hypothetical protein